MRSLKFRRGCISYSPDVLVRYARPWEVDRLLFLEQALAQIRRYYKLVAKARQATKELHTCLAGTEELPSVRC